MLLNHTSHNISTGTAPTESFPTESPSIHQHEPQTIRLHFQSQCEPPSQTSHKDQRLVQGSQLWHFNQTNSHLPSSSLLNPPFLIPNVHSTPLLLPPSRFSHPLPFPPILLSGGHKGRRSQTATPHVKIWRPLRC